VLTGPESGIWILDIDVKHRNGFVTARDLFAAHGVTTRPRTFVVRTPSGGNHWYFRHPEDGRKIGNSAEKRLGPGLDSRGWHGYVVAPGTYDGRGTYELIDNHAPIVAWRWLEDLVEKRRRETRPEPVVTTIEHALTALRASAGRLAAKPPHSGRNSALNEAAFGLARLGMLDRTTAWLALRDACAANGLLDEDGEAACEATFNSGWEAGRQAGEST
jgi:hypothetical protein